MAYAEVSDMVLRFGEAEMIRASTPDGAEAVAIVAAPIQSALDDASAMIDGFLRKRYRVPLDVPPDEIKRACCLLARYDMGFGGEKTISEQTKNARDETVQWLGKIARGEVLLDLAEVAPGDESFATTQSRPPMFGGQGDGGFPGTPWGDWP